jgi:2-amino-4-hydroxy-6-hydroxymethyldihydropteridine diphosphokinase
MTGPNTAGRPAAAAGAAATGTGATGISATGTAATGTGATGTSATGTAATSSRTVVLALGSNLGDRLANLQQGVAVLCGRGLDCRAVSAVFQTAPVGGPAQDDYLNAVLIADSALPAHEVLRRCQQAEAALGRVRTVRWGPRTLDVDIIACGTEVSADPELTLPHPRAHERAFVLAPWLDAEPKAWLPGHGPVAALLAATGSDGVERMPGLRLKLPAPGVELPAGQAGAPCR